MTDCNNLRKRLSDYLVGVLGSFERNRIQNHLQSCADCRAELAALERTALLLSKISLKQAPDRTWYAVKQRIEQGRAPKRALRQLTWRLAMGVAAVAIATTGIFFTRSGHYPASPVATPVSIGAMDDELHASIEGHLTAAWSAPLADEAAIGLRLDVLESDG